MEAQATDVLQNSNNEQFIKNNFICPGVLLSMRVTAD